jgi:glutamyl-tRNA reductase
MTVIALSLNHHTAPLDLRGRFAFGPSDMGRALQSLRTRLATGRGAPEAALLSTCNRTELYLVGQPQAAAELVAPALAWLGTQSAGADASLSAHTVVVEDEAAARHVFRVASGLDSMVLGEPQILGQLKTAVREASAAGTLGSTLHQLFQRSFAVAKEVRTRTELGSHSVSMAAAAVRLAAELFGDLGQLHVLFVGAGDMIDNVATHWAARQPKSMTVANRNTLRGQALAQRVGAQTLALAELPQHLHHFDVVVSCTASALPLIGLGAVERALKARKRRPMLLVDLAVPRDIEPEVKRLADAYLYTVDDLASRVHSAGEKRLAAVEQAEAIVDAGVLGFTQWCEQRGSVPLIQALQHQADEWQRAELQRAAKLLARGEPVDAVLQALAQGLSHKMMHGTLRALHEAQDGQRAGLSTAAARLWLRRDAPLTAEVQQRAA